MPSTPFALQLARAFRVKVTSGEGYDEEDAMPERQQMSIWDELGGEPRSMIKPSGWDHHWASLIDPDADTDEKVAAIIYPQTRAQDEEE